MTLKTLIFSGAALLATTIAAHAADQPAPVVLVTTIKQVPLFEELTYPARVIPRINANILAESDGVVSRIAAPLGDRVRRGQTLMTIRHTDPVYQYAPLVVTSPVPGVVSAVDVTEGSLVNKGDKLAAVTDPDKVRISVEIAAEDLSAIKPGLSGELTLPGREKTVAVKVRGVSPFVDPATGTATAELESSEKQAPGLVGRVHFKINERKGITLPEHAIVYRDGKTFLRIVDAGKARYAEVQLGRKARGDIEILKGVIPGAKVIERASAFIADGEAVSAQEAPAGQDAPPATGDQEAGT